MKLAAGLATEIAGPQGLLWGEDAVDGGVVSKAMVFSAASSIYGGTDEIQHNIIAERTLGLPREPAPDRDRPFGEVLRDARRCTAAESGPRPGALPCLPEPCRWPDLSRVERVRPPTHCWSSMTGIDA